MLVAVTNDSSFWEFLCGAHGTGWSVSWNKNADIDMDQRDYANQTGRSGHNYLIMCFCIYDIAVCWIYAPARMEIGVLQIYELFCKCKFAFICGYGKKMLPVFQLFNRIK